ncbi:hypothetical protein ACWDBD_03780 [Streptomyces sp. NPDC001118]
MKDPQAAVQQAGTAVKQAEARLASGDRSVSAEALHRLRDRFRHASLAADGAQARAEQERQAARLEGLEQVGAEVDRLVSDDTTGGIREALRAAAVAVSKVRALAAMHDGRVADLQAAAADLDVEPIAPGGPRRTSARVATDPESIMHRDSRVTFVSGQVERALGLVLAGDVEAAAAEVRPVVPVRLVERPERLFRGRGGVLVPLSAHPNTHQLAQLRSGDLVELGQADIERYMAGELQ